MNLEISEKQFNLIISAVTAVMLSEKQKAQFIIGNDWKQEQQRHEQRAQTMEELLTELKNKVNNGEFN